MVSSKLSSSSITRRLASLGSERWETHYEARRRIAAGEDIIELTIGEPDIPTPQNLIDVASRAMNTGRTGYASGQGEPELLSAIAQKYSIRTGRKITKENVLALPGTQAALTFSMISMVECKDAVLVPDPYYATYEGVVHASGAEFVPVPMDIKNGFRLTADQIEKALVHHAKALLLNSPHNPTGSILTHKELQEIGEVCRAHNLWILSDEVYESLIYGKKFASPFDDKNLCDHTIVVSSISKSHAAPGFRSGWAVGPAWFIKEIQAVAEAFLFGNQPFIADMTIQALAEPDDTAKVMREAYQRRIQLLNDCFENCEALDPLLPGAGMFMLVDVSKTGMDGGQFTKHLLQNGVAVMPGDVFGNQAKDLIRISLTVEDNILREAAARIIKACQFCR